MKYATIETETHKVTFKPQPHRFAFGKWQYPLNITDKRTGKRARLTVGVPEQEYSANVAFKIIDTLNGFVQDLPGTVPARTLGTLRELNAAGFEWLPLGEGIRLDCSLGWYAYPSALLMAMTLGMVVPFQRWEILAMCDYHSRNKLRPKRQTEIEEYVNETMFDVEEWIGHFVQEGKELVWQDGNLMILPYSDQGW